MQGSRHFQSGVPRNPDVERVSGMSFDGTSDRPRGSTAGSHRGSAPGSQAGSHSASQAGSPPRQSRGAPSTASGPTGSSKVEPLGYDPGRDKKPLTPADLIGKRVDLPADAYLPINASTRYTPRPGYNTTGKPIQIELNIFPIQGFHEQDIYQYDVSVSPIDESKNSQPLIKKVWNSEPVQKFLNENGGTWIHDGNKLAWSSKTIPRNEARLSVDLDQGKPRKKLVGRDGVYFCRIKQTNVIRMSYLENYLKGKMAWDNHVLECMNFFDHCMRQSPSESMVQIRRNFYPKNVDGHPLSNVIEVHKGYYSAIRLSESIKSGGKGLMINIDTANTSFWMSNRLHVVALRMINEHKREWNSWDYTQLASALYPVPTTDKQGRFSIVQSEAFGLLRRLHKLRFTVEHRGKMNEKKVYTIKYILFDEKYGKEGAHSRNVTFAKKMPDGTIKETSVWQHYFDTHQLRLQFPNLPIIETTRGALFPFELCNLERFQRYIYKLEPEQTSKMIKFAVSRPPIRKDQILKGVRHLNFANDPYLTTFGVKVSAAMQKTNCRLLQNPEITFGGNAKHNPGMSGRWDLRGKKFLEPNIKPLISWSFMICGDACDKRSAEDFARKFTQAYRNHGANIKSTALVDQIPFSVGDYSDISSIAWNRTGSHFKEFPQIVFLIVPNKNSLVYERIKKNFDCRFACLSQVLQGGQVKMANAQYMSNVAMKVNAKLGGATCKVAGPNPTTPPFFKEPTMIMGVDVSHAAPGSGSPSMAAMAVSMDKFATRYAASCETNGWRQEIVSAATFHTLFPRLLKFWIKTNGCPPKHVYYLRDGVSEGEFQHVIDHELTELRRDFQEANAGNPKITVIIATKRHHIRFFPKAGDSSTGDRNGNPLPGTLVERDCTHPHHFDFYLCSHVAIQGTARPVHYQVIYDNAKVPPDHLQKMIYQQCYQYCRSTTPVSLHPAVYYSHLASNRARPHENIHASQKEMPAMKAGFPLAKTPREVHSQSQMSSDAPPLLPMAAGNQPPENTAFMNTTMWYV
ncbi:Piwi domain-containing protein [Xylariaceae sp. FL1651]|nr:Piwi domain-containing protein [Xylariaceae sp. FL1651]